jgi:uncharacterized protein
MKHFLSRWSLALLLTAVGIASPAIAGDPVHPAKPLLWKIEGNGLKEPSYLFGTIHLSVPPVGNLHPAAEKAFKIAAAVYTEIPLDSESQLALMPLMIRKDDKTLDNSIGGKLVTELNDELKQINAQLDSTPFQTLKTWAVAMTLPMLKLQLSGEKGLDSKLWERATQEKKTIGALETGASQLKLFDDFSEAEQVIMLEETLKLLREERETGQDSVRELVAAYASGDEKKVLDEVTKAMKKSAEGKNGKLGERFMKTLLIDRDVTLAATIAEELRATPEKVHFFAVGAAHCVGDPGIRGGLTAKGYRITPITE